MEKKSRDIKSLSPQKRTIAALSVALSPSLTGTMTGLLVEVKIGDKIEDVEVDPIVVSGEINVIRPHLHSVLDEILDRYEDLPSTKSEEKKTDKPIIWNPQKEQK